MATAIPADRAGLTICDATSAAFAMEVPWDKLDVVTFSWQKVLGGEAAHGMLVLSPRAVERLESYVPAWPLPKIFRLTKGGKLIEGDLRGGDDQHALDAGGGRLPGGAELGEVGRRSLNGLIARAEANAQVVWDFCAAHDWIANLAERPEIASTTSVCLKFTDPRIVDGAGFAKAVAKRIEAAGAGFDIGAYRDAPPGLANLVRLDGGNCRCRGADALDRLGVPRRDFPAFSSRLT